MALDNKDTNQNEELLTAFAMQGECVRESGKCNKLCDHGPKLSGNIENVEQSTKAILSP